MLHINWTAVFSQVFLELTNTPGYTHLCYLENRLVGSLIECHAELISHIRIYLIFCLSFCVQTTTATRAPSLTHPQWSKKTVVAPAPPLSLPPCPTVRTARPKLTRVQTAREVRRCPQQQTSDSVSLHLLSVSEDGQSHCGVSLCFAGSEAFRLPTSVCPFHDQKVNLPNLPNFWFEPNKFSFKQFVHINWHTHSQPAICSLLHPTLAVPAVQTIEFGLLGRLPSASFFETRICVRLFFHSSRTADRWQWQQNGWSAGWWATCYFCFLFSNLVSVL